MIKVLGDRCLVELSLKTKETDSGIQLVRENDYDSTVGVVIGIGNDFGPVKKGDKILFEDFAGSLVSVGGDDELLYIVDYDDILAIVS